MNLYFKDANFAKLSSAYMYGWKKGLKTIVYYTRTTAAREAIKFTVDKEIEKQMQQPPPSSSRLSEEDLEGIVCSLDNPEACEMCGS
jgi:ribonucleoside-diphosphate reductase alpha chain